MNTLSSKSTDTNISTRSTKNTTKTENGTKVVASGEGADKDLFLKLLVAQMKNQDPFKPQDPTQYITQLAQFNSLESLRAINDGMNYVVNMGNGLLVNSAMSTAASLIGKNVEVFSQQDDSTQITKHTGKVENVYIEDGVINMNIKLDEIGEVKSFTYDSLLKVSD